MFSTSVSFVWQKTLQEAHRLLLNARWWIKADGVDVIWSLEESVRGDWNGDVDLNDEQLELLRSQYLSRLDDVPKVNEMLTITHLKRLIADVGKDLEKINDCTLFIFNMLYYNFFNFSVECGKPRVRIQSSICEW